QLASEEQKTGRLETSTVPRTVPCNKEPSDPAGPNCHHGESQSSPLQFYNDTYSDRTGELIDTFALTLLWSVTVSMFPFGGFIGSLLVGPLVNNLGRKGTLLFNNIFSIVPAIFMGCSKIAKAFELIIISRFLVGICAGVSSNVVPMYLGELAPKNLRGALGVVPQLFITIGILVAQLLGLRNILANEEGERGPCPSPNASPAAGACSGQEASAGWPFLSGGLAVPGTLCYPESTLLVCCLSLCSP
uniref:Solute carrier family 2 member 5 n=1 Tax=Spermophilus dauricus TaxID=99837 RepID=A0A8C9UTW7_SPEDA